MLRAGRRFGVWAALVAMTGALVLITAGTFALAAPQGDPLYPDLKTLEPSELRWDTLTVGSETHHILRFSNIVWNAGQGALELRGNVDATDNVYQRVFDDGGGFTDRLAAVDFIFHPSHNHFHYPDFASYELWRKADWDAWVASGRTGPQQPAYTGAKVSFCILDEAIEDTIPGTPSTGVYRTCAPTVQGLSVGWKDIYRYNLDDQWIDVGTSPAPPGDYIVRAVADPVNNIEESPGGNDSARESEQANEAITLLNVPGTPPPPVDPCLPPVTSEIACENSKPGNPIGEWSLSGVGDATIQGFATQMSIDQGQTVNFKIKTPASNYTIDIYRIGYYAGSGARKVATVSPSATLPQTQPACVTDSSVGLVDCGNWGVSASWAVPATAVSGVYVAKLTRTDTGGKGHIWFVVRDDDGGSDVLFQTADTTWQAYNRYGGYSLYTGPTGRAYKVSYNRPFDTRINADHSWFMSAEYPMIRWLERNGYDVSYTSGLDTHLRGPELLEHRAFLSNGHDEYWSGPQRTNVEAARNAGVNLAFFSGNEVFWKTRWEGSIAGPATPNRTLVSYKETHAGLKLDPDPAWTGTWRDPRFTPPSDGGRPENALTGQIFMVNGYEERSIVVPEPEGKLRLWRHTPLPLMSPGGTTVFPAGTLGYEWDEDQDNGHRPPGLVRLSSATYTVPAYLTDHGSAYGTGTATHRLTMYRHSSGALVFGAGTIQWSWGLDQNHDKTSGGAPLAPDWRMQQATVNLFADMNVHGATLQTNLVAASPSTDTTRPTTTITSPAPGANLQADVPITITGTAVDAGGGVVGGVEVSTDNGATWHPANGRENWTYVWTPLAGPTATIKTRAVDDSGSLELPSAGVTVNVQPSAGLVLALAFNEASGATVDDVSPSNNDGTITNATRTATAKYGSAINFDGAGDWVTVPDAGSLDLTNGMTLEAWVRPTGGSSWRTVMMKEEPGDFTYALYSSTSSGTPRGYANLLDVESSALPASTWTHLALTYNGSVLRLYRNGVEVDSLTGTTTMANSALPFRIGGNSVWGEYFTGQIDEVRVYNRAISAAAIQADMATPVGPPDAAPPTVSVTEPAAGANVSGTNVSVKATASDNVGVVGVQFRLDGAPLGPEDTSAPYEVTWNTTLVGNGPHNLTAVARDAANLSTTSAAVSVNVDNIPDTTDPTVAVTAPADGATVGGASVNVAANASDNVAVAGVQFKLDGANLGAEDTSAPYELSWNTAPVANGPHVITAVARDGASNTATSSEIDVVVDNDIVAPTVAMTAPAAGNVSGATVTVSASASDDRGVVGVQFRLDGAPLGAEDTTAPYSISWDSRTTANGPHQLSAVARDAASNTTTATPVAVTVNNPVTGLVAALGFDETSGTTAADASGFTNHGALNGPAWTPAGRHNGALSFDGIDDWVTLADAASLDLSTGMTLEAWLKPTAPSGWETALMKETADDFVYGLYANTSADSPRAYVNDSLAEGAAGLAAGVWSHVAATYDGAALRVYVDGVQVDSAAVTSTIAASTGALRIGGNSIWTDEGFQGLIDEVRVYNRALTQAAIQADMATPIGAPPAPDTTDPTVAVTDPADAATVAGTGVSVKASASDNVGVAGVQFKLDGANLGAEDTSAPYEVSWDTTLVGNGPHTLSAVARDAANNTASATNVSVTVNNVPDTTDPTVVITTPADGATVGGASVNVAADASDNVGVAGVQFKLDGANLGPEDTSAPYAIVWSTAPVANGPHVLTAVARDGANNTATSAEIDVVVDNDVTPPTVALTEPADGAGVTGSVAVKATAGDDRGVSGVQFRLDGANLGVEDTSAPYEVSWNTVGATNGPHALTAVARDAANNSTTATTRTVTVNNPVTGLVVALGFDETTGANAPDSSGFGNHGALSGATWTATGRHNGALSFDGTNDWVTVADAASLDLTTGMTLEAWVRPSAGGGWRTALLKETASHLSYALYTNTSAGSPRAYAALNFAEGGTLPLNAWTHLAATYDGAAVRLYVNGTEVDSLAATTAMTASAQPLRIGGNAIWDEHFAGLIDEVRVYNRALTPGAIQADMATPIGSPPAPDTADPTVGMTAPAAGTVSGPNVTVSASASDNIGVAGVQFLLDGNPLGAEDTSAPYSITWDTTTATNGPHQLSARARDAAGNDATATAVAVTVDNVVDTTDPTVAMTAPSAGTVSGSNVTVSATASDNVSVAGVQFLLDGNPLGAEDTIAPYSITWDSKTASNAPHQLSARARDGAGNDATSTAVDVTVDNDLTAPGVSMTAPPPGNVSGPAVSVEAIASDNVGVAGVQFLLDGNPLGGEDTTAPYSFTWDSRTAGNGPHQLSARARDGAGNTATSSAVAVTVNNPVTGLVAALGFNEGAGAGAADVSGFGNNATLGNGAGWSATGKYGAALSLDGVNDWATVADASSLDLTTGMTLEAWVNPTTLTGWRTALMKETATSHAYAIYANRSADDPIMYINNLNIDGTTKLPVGAWSHVAATYDGAVMRLYVNGLQVGSFSRSATIQASTQPLRIGGNALWGEYFHGLIDEVRVYNRALTQAAIQADMAAPVS